MALTAYQQAKKGARVGEFRKKREARRKLLKKYALPNLVEQRRSRKRIALGRKSAVGGVFGALARLVKGKKA